MSSADRPHKVIFKEGCHFADICFNVNGVGYISASYITIDTICSAGYLVDGRTWLGLEVLL